MKKITPLILIFLGMLAIVWATTLDDPKNLGADKVPNVKDISEARAKVQANDFSEPIVVSEDTSMQVKMYLWSNVTKQNKGTVIITK